MLCLVQFVNGVPQEHLMAKNLRELKDSMPDGFRHKDITAVLARMGEEPEEGQYGLGDGYWLLATRNRSWLDRLLPTA